MRISSTFFLTCCFAVVSYAISALFMSGWGTASQSLSYSLLLDLKVNENVAVNCPQVLEGLAERKRNARV